MSEQEKKQAGKGILVISIIAIVVVAVLVGIIVFLLKSQNKPEEKRQTVVTEDNVEEVLEEIKEQDEQVTNVPDHYTVTMDNIWHFKSGSEASYDAKVLNVDMNETAVYFDVVMADNEEDVLYSSPVIPVGGRLDDIKLDRALSAGTYETVVIYHLVDDQQNTLSYVRVYLTLVVES